MRAVTMKTATNKQRQPPANFCLHKASRHEKKTYSANSTMYYQSLSASINGSNIFNVEFAYTMQFHWHCRYELENATDEQASDWLLEAYEGPCVSILS